MSPGAAPAGSDRFRVNPPYLDPDFIATFHGPAPKNYGLALGEVVFIDAAIWTYDYLMGQPYVKISSESIKQNFDKGWIIDTDDYWANGLMHPLHGNLTYNAGRSLGLNFYESFVGSFIGSLIWEQFGEIQPPSMNDQVNTPFGGSLVGEMAFRISRLILDSGGYNPSWTRRIFAFLINPVGGLNRLVFQEKYRGDLLLPPSWIGEFRVGAVVYGSDQNGEAGARNVKVGPWLSFSTNIVYGVPGTPGLTLRQPFDHFEASGWITFMSNAQPAPDMAINVRGLLIGDTLGPGGDEGGLWGLFTSYDFIAPETFRVQGFGLGPGVALMKRWDWFTLHGFALAEFLPWSGAGSTIPLGVRDYHYGPGVDGELSFRMHFGDRFTLWLDGREYYITGAYSTGANEDMTYLKAAGTFRVWNEHALTASLEWSYRQARYPLEPDVWQRGTLLNVYYTFLQGW